jgi:signal transduction histidine kinase
MTRRARAEAEVAVATAELRERTTLMLAIMNSVGEGVLVVDHRGEVILYNPAARRYLEIDDEGVARSAWDEPSQVFRPDGVTPFPAAELPLARALAGESTEDVEVVVRKGGRSQEYVVIVSAGPLDGRAGRPGAVAVFHDITARKHVEEAIAQNAARLSIELDRREKLETVLRAREAELTAFAGVVAHDLKSPLSTVAGFTELLQDDLADAPPGARDAASSEWMNRILAAVKRMGLLIDDLLTFATDGDRALHPQPVDLRALVALVVAERTTLGPGSTAPPPRIEVEQLPGVHADPMMCRQLLDNLIGNAIKYTQPDRPAHIEISAHPEPGHGIRVEIADHGIGIPPGEHEHVFDSFHRAHTDGTYTGTGLGLAICKRIVERHGGSIGVSDNPGGGSRFHFTLPAEVESEVESAVEAPIAETRSANPMPVPAPRKPTHEPLHRQPS